MGGVILMSEKLKMARWWLNTSDQGIEDKVYCVERALVEIIEYLEKEAPKEEER